MVGLASANQRRRKNDQRHWSSVGYPNPQLVHARQQHARRVGAPEQAVRSPHRERSAARSPRADRRRRPVIGGKMDQQTKSLLELSRQHQAAMEYSRRALTEL